MEDNMMNNFKKKLKHILNKIWKALKQFYLSIWEILKEIGNLKSLLSFILTFAIMSGTAFIIIGYGANILWMTTTGYSMLALYFAPTASLPINIVLSLIVQRYIFQDKNVSVRMIKDQWKEVKIKLENKTSNNEEEE